MQTTASVTPLPEVVVVRMASLGCGHTVRRQVPGLVATKKPDAAMLGGPTLSRPAGTTTRVLHVRGVQRRHDPARPGTRAAT